MRYEKKKRRNTMQEVEVEDNELNLRVFINGVPDFTKMPKEIAESFLSALEQQIVEFYKK